ncbi:phosphatidylserine decarboxylase [Acidipila rosea]|uniref:Phosphatidylserine decarboxylase proenzyme n=2 Tax=Acidipila rosea TaxID=768535 RepID=A0A4R1L721_9BACT|nr:phosphatidylserine decarboxylase family protein [Acidipila rosea]TCK72089.1 phosphatidylserine decarboxylase [Acidipila rosea]
MVRDGYFYGLALIAVAVLVWFLTGSLAWPVFPLLLAAFFLWFFRDPERQTPQEPGLIISPADGKVTRLERVRTPEGERIHISIFLSVFNVHVNRSPSSGVLRNVTYQKGLYLNALNPDSAEKNEQMRVVLDSDEGYSVSFKMIAGLLARRIVFNYKTGDRLQRGQRVGLIKFGSRVDVMLPSNALTRIKMGDTVKGASTVLAEIPNGVSGVDDAMLAESLA